MVSGSFDKCAWSADLHTSLLTYIDTSFVPWVRCLVIRVLGYLSVNEVVEHLN